MQPDQRPSSRFFLILNVTRYLSLCLSLLVYLSALPALAQANLGSLNTRLQEAVNTQNWTLAIQIIDQMIVATPDRATELRSYRQRLQQLQQSGVRVPQTTSSSPASGSNPNPVGLATIKRRLNGIPVIEVKFNNRVPFEMMVDTGASMTVITRSMARALGITPANVVDRIVFSTANGKISKPIVYVNSMEVAGLAATQIPVAVAGPDMEMGLLGQDFLQRFDVSMRRGVIEFHLRR